MIAAIYTRKSAEQKGRTVIALFTVCCVAAVASGCFSIPEPRPVHTLNYDFDKDKQQWTKTRCVTSARTGDEAHSVETVCRTEIIAAPPSGIEKRVPE